MSVSAVAPRRKRLSEGLTVTQKVFVRSRNGGATKIVREHYLRSDIPCLSRSCTKCQDIVVPDAQNNLPKFVLSESPQVLPKPIGKHYVVLDTNIVLQAIDLLENPDCFFDVIVPQIVLDEVRNRSYPVYTRLRTLCRDSDDKKRFVVFHNEFSENTFVERKKDETINDRNDRAIRKTCKWYANHLKEYGISVILVTNDRLNRNAATSDDDIITKSLFQYVDLLPNSNEIKDLIPNLEAANEANTKEEDKEDISEFNFSEYYPTARIMGGLKNGVLYQGNIQISEYNFLEGSVSIPGFSKPVLIVGEKNLNRAFNGDQVVIELLPQTEWKAPSTIALDSEHFNVNDNPDAQDEDEPSNATSIISDTQRRLLAKDAIQAQKAKKVQPTARVVAIPRRSWRQYVGQIAPNSVDLQTGGTQNVFVILMDKCLPKIRIRTRRAKELLDKRIVISVDSWPTTHKYPLGHFVRDLGGIETAQAETEALLLEHDVEYRPFSKKVLECLPAEGHEWKAPEVLTDLHMRI